jgi:threonine aldolase
MKKEVWRGFASDNYAGVDTEVIKRMVLVNQGHEVAYGDDTVTDDFNKLVNS